MAITLTQSKAWHVQTSGTTNPLAFTGAVSSGGCVTVYIAYDSTATISTVLDDKSNSYAVKSTITETPDAIKISQAVLGNITNGPTTITVTFTGTVANTAVSIAEWAGISAIADPTDVTGGQMAASSANPTSGNVTTTVDGDLVTGFAVNGSTNVIYTVGSGFTAGQSTGTFFTSTSSLAWEWLIQTTHGAIAGTWVDATATNYAANVLTLKAAAAGGGALPFNQSFWAKPQRLAKAPYDLSISTNPNLFKNPIPILNLSGATDGWGVVNGQPVQPVYNVALYNVTVTVTLMGQVWC